MRLLRKNAPPRIFACPKLDSLQSISQLQAGHLGTPICIANSITSTSVTNSFDPFFEDSNSNSLPAYSNEAALNKVKFRKNLSPEEQLKSLEKDLMKDTWFKKNLLSANSRYVHIPKRISESKREASEIVDEIFDELKYATAHLPSRNVMDDLVF